MRTWAQRAQEAELHDPAPEECLDCHGPILDRGERLHWPSACECPSCDWCGAHGADVETVLVEDDEVCGECQTANQPTNVSAIEAGD
jgi:hypothetical protein